MTQCQHHSLIKFSHFHSACHIASYVCFNPAYLQQTLKCITTESIASNIHSSLFGHPDPKPYALKTVSIKLLTYP